jgi:cell division protein FtsZ
LPDVEVLAQNFPLIVIGTLLVLLAARVLVGFIPGRRARRRSRAPQSRRTIRVIGVGGGGGNAVNEMIRAGTRGVDFIACNTDAQALTRSFAVTRLQIGEGVTSGLGAGGDPVMGQRAAQEDAERIAGALSGSDIVFVTAGLGGGTGSGAAPVIASIAKAQGALTIGVVTKPFSFEGNRRAMVADAAMIELGKAVDTLITIPNDRVRDVVPETESLVDAFKVVDDVLRQGVQGILEIITVPGLINLDFADLRAVMKDAGPALMGVGRAKGVNRAVDAARQAVANVLLEETIDGARGILFVVSGSKNLRLDEVTRAAETIRASADPDANVIFGATLDSKLKDQVRITVVATGFDPARQPRPTTRMRMATPLDEDAHPESSERGERERIPVGPDPADREPSTRTRRGVRPDVAPDDAAAPGDASMSDDLDVPSFLRRN